MSIGYYFVGLRFIRISILCFDDLLPKHQVFSAGILTSLSNRIEDTFLLIRIVLASNFGY